MDTYYQRKSKVTFSYFELDYPVREINYVLYESKRLDIAGLVGLCWTPNTNLVP